MLLLKLRRHDKGDKRLFRFLTVLMKLSNKTIRFESERERCFR
ncbi:hypothetical protein LINGRAHAP2_LOCUS4001 [Linum grandiflorum]